MELSKEERSAKRRELAIRHQEMRQLRKAEELAKLPPEVLKRSWMRYQRHGRARNADFEAIPGYSGPLKLRYTTPVAGEAYFFIFTGTVSRRLVT